MKREAYFQRIGLAADTKVDGRRQLTLSCVAICVAVGEKLRNRA